MYIPIDSFLADVAATLISPLFIKSDSFVPYIPADFVPFTVILPVVSFVIIPLFAPIPTELLLPLIVISPLFTPCVSFLVLLSRAFVTIYAVPFLSLLLFFINIPTAPSPSIVILPVVLFSTFTIPNLCPE